jgi:hypothetical protein
MSLENGPRVLYTDTVAVPKGDVAYSKSFDLTDLDVFALEYQAACTGLPNVKIEVQQCSDGVNWYSPDTLADINPSLTNTDLHGCQLILITVRHMRLKLTEVTDTVTDLVMTIRISVQKRFASGL